MKKVLLLVLVTVIVFSYGCSSNTSTTATLPVETTGASVATLGTASISEVDSIFDSMGISSSSVDDVNTPTRDGNWWLLTSEATVNGFSSSYTYYFRMLNNAGNEIVTYPELQSAGSDGIDRIWMYSIDSISTNTMSYTLSIGTGKNTGEYMRFENRNTAQETMNGPIEYTGPYDGTSFTIRLGYTDMKANDTYPDGEESYT